METGLVVVLVLMAGAVGVLAGVLRERQRAAAALERERAEWEERSATAAAAQAAEQARLRAELEQRSHELVGATSRLEAWQAQQKTEAARLKELESQFEALAQKVVRDNSEQFLKNAGATLEERGKAIETMLAPFKETLAKLEQGAQALEVKREGAYAGLTAQLKELAETTHALHTSSTTLSNALRGGSSARGRWGEMQLQNIAELAGMTAHCDFETQVVLDGARPDMVVNLPGGEGRIPVDAKAPMDAYMRALDAAEPAERSAQLVAHASALRNHVRDLARKDYASALGTRVDFTVMFVPGDPILAAAFEAAPDLQQEAMERRVLIATPVTLIALLRTVALYWRQQMLADNAQVLWEEAREFHKRVSTFMEHFDGLGGALGSALAKYNKAVGSYESRVLPQGRRLEELAPPEKALPALDRLEEPVRTLPAGTPAPVLDSPRAQA